MAVRRSPRLFAYASQLLQSDRQLVLAAIQGANVYKPVLDLLPEADKDCKELVLMALDRVPLSLQHASERLRDDEELVCSVIQKDVRAIRIGGPRRGSEMTAAL